MFTNYCTFMQIRSLIFLQGIRFQNNFHYLEGKVKHWLGSPVQGRGRRYSSRAKVLDTNRSSVIEYVFGLPDELATATHIVMTTYQTMRVRGLIPTKTLVIFYKSISSLEVL